MDTYANQQKAAWFKTHYAQIKFSVEPELASEFKKACAAAGVSMASVICGDMRAFCGQQRGQKSDARAKTGSAHERAVQTLPQRRKAVGAIIQKLDEIKRAEEQYEESFPENLRESVRHEAAEQNVSALSEAIEQLENAYFP